MAQRPAQAASTRRVRRPPAPALMACAVLAVACSDSDIVEPEPAVAFVSGRVAALQGQSVDGAVARVFWDGVERGANVTGDGLFSVGMPMELVGSGVLVVEAGPDHHPAWIRLDDDEVDEVRVVLVPREWTVRGGAFAGATVAIDPNAAADGRVLPSYWGFIFPFRQDGFQQTVVDSTRWLGQLMTWPDDAFPLPLIIDRQDSDVPITAADSAALWDRVDELEAVLGWDAFHPGRIDQVEVDTLGGRRSVPGAVTVRVDSQQPFRGLGGAAPDSLDWLWDDDAALWSGGSVLRVTVFSADLAEGRISLRETALFKDPRIVPHELMHVLGAGHGCTWASVQTYCTSLSTDLPTAQDVAHLEVLGRVRHLAGLLDTRHGVLAAVFGHRVVTLGLDPVPTPDLLFGPDNTLLGVPDMVPPRPPLFR